MIPTLRGGASSIDYDDESSLFDGEVESVFGPKGSTFLYGFQGRLMFGPTWAQYQDAVKQLLSLRSSDDTKYSCSLIHFNKDTKQILSTTHDTLPFNAESPSWHYMQQQIFLSSFNTHVFFIKFRDEPNPPHWEPLPMQFETDVARLWGNATEDWASDVGSSCAYLAFPKTVKAAFDPHDFAANQYNAHLQAAVEVIAGTPRESCSKKFWVLSDHAEDDQNLQDIPMVYGALGQHSETWKKLSPLANPHGKWVAHSTTVDGDVALVLPNYFPLPSENDRLALRGRLTYARTLQTIARKAFGANGSKRLQRLLVIPGWWTRGSFINREKDGFIIEMGDNLRFDELHLKNFAEVLYQQDFEEPYLILHPVWKTDETFLYAGWDLRSAYPARSQMPSLKSTLSEVRQVVRSLCGTTNREPTYLQNEHYISFRPKNWSLNCPFTDRATYAIGPDTTEDEWYTIRLSLTAREYIVNIHDKKDIDWRTRICKSNVWGPRYKFGPARSGSKPVSLDETAELSQRPSSFGAPNTWFQHNATASKDDSPEHAPEKSGRAQVAPERASGNAGLGMPPVDKSDRERTWATQPSIFDNINGRLNPTGHRFGIPINAPPSEQVLRTFSSVPMVSKAILTPTEQARLQKDFWDLRNVILWRVSTCPYENCDFTYRFDDPASFKTHLQFQHQIQHCTLCDEPLFQWWSRDQRLKHLKTAHGRELRDSVDIEMSGDSTGIESAWIPQNEPWYADENDETSMHSPLRFPVPEQQSDREDQETREDRKARKEREGLEKVKSIQAIFKELRLGLARTHEAKKCPFFKDCGAAVGDMTEDQMIEHMRTSHNHILGIPDESDDEFDEEESDGDSSPHYDDAPGKRPVRASAVARRTSKAPSHEDELRNFDDPNTEPSYNCPTSPTYYNPQSPRYAPASPPSHGKAEGKRPVRASTVAKRKSKAPSPRAKEASPELGTELETVSEGSDESDLEESIIAQISGAPPRAQPSGRKYQATVESVDDDIDIGLDDDKSYEEPDNDVDSLFTDENEEASEDDPIEAVAKEVDKRRCRAPSPDWVAKLGPSEDGFEPGADMYCSKCLRKAPKVRDRSPGRSPLGRNVEMEFHSDPERCCKIRRGVGSAENLPNRSGWIPASDIRKRMGQIKQKFVKKFPAYERTIYPINKSDYHASLWRSDPNNEVNKDFWNIPWPPYEGDPPFPGDWEHPDEVYQLTTGKRKKSQKIKEDDPNDPEFNYNSDHDSVDNLEAEAVPEVEEVAGKKKRRRADEQATKVKGEDKPMDSIEASNGRAVKKVKITAEASASGADREKKKGKRGRKAAAQK